MYIQSNVAISTGKVKEFDMVCKVSPVYVFGIYIGHMVAYWGLNLTGSKLQKRESAPTQWTLLSLQNCRSVSQ